ncbi:MAG: alkaline phosphatase family protein [Anaerolineales bacterium]
MKTILVGFDAFDPHLYEKLHNQGNMPNISRFLASSGYAPLRVSNPPQSEVSWTSIATGLNPGGHGIFDFVHRNPKTYGLFVSLLPTQESILGKAFIPPHQTETIFDAAAKDGYPATSLWWPATFPARLGLPVRSIPGLGTPDIFGKLGAGISYSVEPFTDEANLKTRTARIHRRGKDVYQGTLFGPDQQNHSRRKDTTLDFRLTVLDEESAKFSIGKQVLDLQKGIWSPVIELNFNIGFLISLKIVTRILLTKMQPAPALYVLPLQLHPLKSPWPYGSPKGMLRKIWKTQGPFLTLGWPQDTTALEEGFITEDQFLRLCDQIRMQREQVLMDMLDSFTEGLLACVFDSLDRIQHMFWKNQPEVVESWYLKLDDLAGRITAKLAAKADGDEINLMFLSDHGFQNYDFKVNVNRWLIRQGYLSPSRESNAQGLSGVDWGRSQAYAIGLNSLYLNLAGREKQGTVTNDQSQDILERLRAALLEWTGPDGRKVFANVQRNEKAFHGPLAKYGPDLVLGFSPGYRASPENGIGRWHEKTIRKNTDHWGADHCFDADAVPGVIFNSHGLGNFPTPSYTDIPAMTIGRALDDQKPAEPVLSDEDQETLEERLKGLGYL